MILPPFALHRPRTLDELVRIAAELRASACPFDYLAGGTDIVPNYKNRINAKPHVISLSALEGFDTVSLERIGARARVEAVANDSVLSEHYPGLTEAARLVSSPPLRNLGTVGGNLLLDTRCYWVNQSAFWRASRGHCLKADGDVCLVVPQETTCYATYSADLAPILLVLDASVSLAGPDGERGLRLREFYLPDGIRRFDKKPEELLTWIDIPRRPGGLRTGYRKLRVRDTIEYPVMGVALGLATRNGTVTDLRVAVTGSEAIPVYYGDFGLTGRAATEATARELGAVLRHEVKTYRNVPFPPGYRKAMAGEFASELFLALA